MPGAVWVSVDYRGGHEFASSFPRALELVEALAEAGHPARLLNVNEPLSTLACRTASPGSPANPASPASPGSVAGAVVFVLADTFAPLTEGHRRWPEERGFRRCLEHFGVPYVGSSYHATVTSSSSDKVAARERLRRRVPVPRSVVARRGEPVDAEALSRRLGLPLVVKRAVRTGASVGVHLAETPAAVADAIAWETADSGHDVLVEEYVRGPELTAWIHDEAGEPRCYLLAEVRKPPDMPLLHNRGKSDCRIVRRPGPEPVRDPQMVLEPDLPAHRLEHARRTALAAHRACGLRHYSRVDMILAGEEPVVLEANAVPVLSEGGLGAAARLLGDSLPAFVSRLVEEALAGHHHDAGSRPRVAGARR